MWTKAVDEELHPACSAITYVVSHRHTILRNGGLCNFEEFVARGANEGMAARAQKWQWIQHGLEAPGAAEKIRLYDAYLHKMERALASSEWLVGERFSMADIAMAPYLNRLAALSMEGIWRSGRLPRVERWFERVSARPRSGRRSSNGFPPSSLRNASERGAIVARGRRAARYRRVR